MVTLTGVPEPFTLNSSFWQLANMVCFLSASGSSSLRKCDVAALHRGMAIMQTTAMPTRYPIQSSRLSPLPLFRIQFLIKNEIATMSTEEIINPTKALMEEENASARAPSISMPSNTITCFFKFTLRLRSIFGNGLPFLKAEVVLWTQRKIRTYETVQETKIPTIRRLRRSSMESENRFPGFCRYRYTAHASNTIRTG